MALHGSNSILSRLTFTTATITTPFLCSIIEPAFAIICACLSAYRPLFTWASNLIPFQRFFNKIKSLPSDSHVSVPNGETTPAIVNINRRLIIDNSDVSSPRFTAAKWAHASNLKSGFPAHLPPIPLEQDISTTNHFSPKNCRAYDETWADGLLTWACDGGVFYEYSNESRIGCFTEASREDSATSV